MPIDLHPNDNGREGRPAVCGAAALVALFCILAACGVDSPVDIGISVSPLLAIVGYLHLFGNGKSPTFATDIMLFLIWGAKAWLSTAGVLDWPAVLWVGTRTPSRPEDF
jgi:hypothetical protein